MSKLNVIEMDAKALKLVYEENHPMFDKRINLPLDEGLVLKALESPEGQRVMLRVAGKNRRAFGRALGG